LATARETPTEPRPRSQRARPRRDCRPPARVRPEAFGGSRAAATDSSFLKAGGGSVIARRGNVGRRKARRLSQCG
jgi:hypothetical protein